MELSGTAEQLQAQPFATLAVQRSGPLLQVTLNRPAQRNAIDSVLLAELHRVIDQAEADVSCRAVVLAGTGGVFCSGMDFEEAAEGSGSADFEQQAGAYIRLLRRLTETPRVMVASVDGLAAGGGVGLAAACDLVVATPSSTFSLPEALWGLLPCCVLPYLVRRIGFQPAYRMALTTQAWSAEAAQHCHLVDSVSDRPGEAIRKLLLRTLRADADVVGALKQTMRELSAVSAETEQSAVAALCRLVARPQTRAAISAYATQGVFPWANNLGGMANV